MAKPPFFPKLVFERKKDMKTKVKLFIAGLSFILLVILGIFCILQRGKQVPKEQWTFTVEMIAAPNINEMFFPEEMLYDPNRKPIVLPPAEEK